MKGCLLAVGVLVVALAGYVSYSGYYVPWRYLAPYRALVERHATEEEAIKTPHYDHGVQSGKPDWVLRGPEELAKFTKYQHLRNNESKVFVYCSDPWNDGEGFKVYLYFDESGRATRVELGPC